MIHPITITEASTVTRKLQKDRSHRHSILKENSECSPKPTYGSARARQDSFKLSKLVESKRKSLQSPRSNFSSESSLISAHPEAPQSLRIYTKGALLTSGFAYHPGLFDLNVHPIMWEKFTSQVVDTARLTPKERAKVWAVGTAAAVTISSSDSYHVGRNKIQRYQEEKVKDGLASESEDSLGDLLRQWNEGYFAERGLLARLDLCDAAQNSSSHGSKVSQREAHGYPHKEDRECVRAGRKFSLVVTQISEREELAKEVDQACATKRSTRSLDSHRSDYTGSSVSADYKPLPGLPVGADPLLDVAAEFTKLDHRPTPKLHPALHMPELEGEPKSLPVVDTRTSLCQSGPERLLDDVPKTPEQREFEVFEEMSSHDWPLEDGADEVHLCSEVQPEPVSESGKGEAGTEVREHLTAELNQPDGHLVDDDIVSSRSKLPEERNQAMNKPMASPTTSFFIPLDFKAVSSTLDFDPKRILQDVAIAR